jgi:hypothetical protein
MKTFRSSVVLSLCLLAGSTAMAGTYLGVVAWGDDTYGQCDVPAGVKNVVSVACGGTFSCALLADSTVAVWGKYYNGSAYVPMFVPSGLTNVIAIAAGVSHCLALKTDGTVVAWGLNNWNQCNVPSGLNGVAAISAGGACSLATRTNGIVVGWGSDDYGQCDSPTVNVTATATSGDFTLALRADGTVAAWGNCVYWGQCSVPAGLNGVSKIATGGYTGFALETNGTVVAWGNNSYGQCNIPTGNVLAIAAGPGSCLALKSDGTMAAWGLNEGQGNLPPALNGVVGISTSISGFYSLAIVPLLVPTVWQQLPAAISLPYGASNNLSIAGSSVSSLGCQWFFNGAVIPGANGTNFPIPSFSPSQAGAYSISVSNQLGQGSATFVVRLANSPVVLVDGVDVGGGTIDRFNSAQVTMSTTFGVGASIYYTLDGSTPDFTKKVYSGSFALTHSATIRAIAYNQSFTESAEAEPITVQMFGAATDGGGSMSLSPASGSGFDGYVTNTLVTATATTSNGWAFLGWLGNATGANPVVTTAMTLDKGVKAIFGAMVSTNVLGSGSIVFNPAGSLYPYGSSVRVWAVPQNGNRFFGWQGSVTGTNNPATLVINQPTQTVTATFASLSAGKYSITAICDGKGTLTVNPYATYYNTGQTVALTPLPDAGQSFIGWTGDASGTANPLLVTMNQSQIITADFSKRPSLQVGTTIDGMFENGFMLTLNGEFGAAYQIYTSTNLTTWTPLGTVTNTFGVSQFLDANGTNAPLGFYRLMQTGQ